MEPIDYTEPWMILPGDEDSKGDFLRGLVCGTFWFAVDHHPELGDLFEPGWDDKIAFLLGADAQGEFTPVYTSPEVMRINLEQFGRPYSRARMTGADLLIALRDTTRPMVINPGTTNPLSIPPAGIHNFGVALLQGKKANEG